MIRVEQEKFNQEIEMNDINNDEKKKEVKLNENVQILINNHASHLVAMKLIAKNMFAYYENLIAEGFTEQQAFQIILTRGMTP